LRHQVIFLPEYIKIEVESGTTIMQACRDAGIPIDAPCGGNGTCGKCLVRIIDEGGKAIVKHACKTCVDKDMTVDVSSRELEHRILHDCTGGVSELMPVIRNVTVEVRRPSVGDRSSEWERFAEAISGKLSMPAGEIAPNPRLAATLYKTLKDNDYKVDALVCESEVIGILEPGGQYYAIAFDIGTTTIVGYLLDLRTGNQTAVSSTLNPQSVYGADVVMRSKYAIENGTRHLSDVVHEALNAIIRDTASKAGIDPSQICLVTAVGNTCMHHLFLGISPESLVFAPYTPALSEALLIDARDYDISVNDGAKLMMLPNIAGFVGADTTGAVLASGLDRSECLTLLIDIGTNGEIVLGDSRRMVACSAAAGPAFEGALIKFGMRGAEGAIDHFSIEGSRTEYTVIGGTKPVGICGSGLIDAVAQLIEKGLVDTSGRIADPEVLTQSDGKPGSHISQLAGRIRSIDGLRCFILADENESGTGTPIYITQKDIREVQLAKAAIAAGIKLLGEHLGVGTADIAKVLIAGAFGNYMSPRSACLISMIPPELEDRIVPIGNAAGEGAKRAALSSNEFEQAKRIAAKCEFIELAAHPSFQDIFIDELEFSLN